MRNGGPLGIHLEDKQIGVFGMCATCGFAGRKTKRHSARRWLEHGSDGGADCPHCGTYVFPHTESISRVGGDCKCIILVRIVPELSAGDKHENPEAEVLMYCTLALYCMVDVSLYVFVL